MKAETESILMVPFIQFLDLFNNSLGKLGRSRVSTQIFCQNIASCINRYQSIIDQLRKSWEIKRPEHIDRTQNQSCWIRHILPCDLMPRIPGPDFSVNNKKTNPCSNSINSGPKLAPATTPGPPASPAAIDPIIEPYKFPVMITSNWLGSFISCMLALSTIISSYSNVAYFSLTPLQVSKNNPSAIFLFPIKKLYLHDVGLVDTCDFLSP